MADNARLRGFHEAKKDVIEAAKDLREWVRMVHKEANEISFEHQNFMRLMASVAALTATKEGA